MIIKITNITAIMIFCRIKTPDEFKESHGHWDWRSINGKYRFVRALDHTLGKTLKRRYVKKLAKNNLIKIKWSKLHTIFEDVDIRLTSNWLVVLPKEFFKIKVYLW